MDEQVWSEHLASNPSLLPPCPLLAQSFWESCDPDPHADSWLQYFPLDVSTQATQTVQHCSRSLSAALLPGGPHLHTHSQGTSTDIFHLHVPHVAYHLQNPCESIHSSLPLLLSPGHSLSLDICSSLSLFPHPLSPSSLWFWPVCWTHWGLGVGNGSLHVKKWVFLRVWHVWLHTQASTHAQGQTHAHAHMRTPPSWLLGCVRRWDHYLRQTFLVK